MTAYNKTKQSLQSHKLQPKKKFGQNFLVHKQTAENIAAKGSIQKDDIILEVGVGLGALTLPIANRARKVIGLEIDSGIVRFHEEEKDLPDNVEIIHQDVLKANFAELQEQCEGRKLRLMANLPYSISNPFIFKLIENEARIQDATIMLQKEVADRLSAEVNTKDYGIPTILLSRCATVTKLLTLKPAEFHPRPKVDSVVVKIDFTKPAFSTDINYDPTIFTALVRAGFSQRRKTILNTLGNTPLFPPSFDLDKSQKKSIISSILTKIDISPKARAETLTHQDFVLIAHHFQIFLNEEDSGK